VRAYGESSAARCTTGAGEPSGRTSGAEGAAEVGAIVVFTSVRRVLRRGRGVSCEQELVPCRQRVSQRHRRSDTRGGVEWNGRKRRLIRCDDVHKRLARGEGSTRRLECKKTAP
jgi:hypothetical protein